jgi:hypothetical protein
MVDNIKIIGQVLDVQRVNRYTLQDETLLNPIIEQSTFGYNNDYIEYFVSDLGGNVLNVNYDYSKYKLPSNSAYSQSFLPNIEIDPIQDIQDLGYESGELNVRYNIFRKIASEPFSNHLFIQQISTDRTELRIGSTDLSNAQLTTIAQDFANKQAGVPFYYSVILNFGNNKQVVAVNIVSEINTNGTANILIKLYEPLPLNISLKDTFWIVEEIVNPYVFSLNLDKLITPTPQPSLRGPNFEIDLELKNVLPTPYSNLNQLITSLTGSAYQVVLNTLSNQHTHVNVKYNILNDFIHFSSAESRLSNFMFKIGEIENYQNEISSITPMTASNASLIFQVNTATASLNNIIAGFDGFESYLYYTSSSLTSSIVEYTVESGSFFEYVISPYPKQNPNQPYSLYASYDTIVENWYTEAISVSQTYDSINKDILINTIPEYIREDESNYLPYIMFVNMMGQYFDNIWIYIEKLTDVWNNDNNIQKGISEDLIFDWLKSFGVKLYNSHGDQSVLDYNIGSYSGSVDAPNPACKSIYFKNLNSNNYEEISYVDCYYNGVIIQLPPNGSLTTCSVYWDGNSPSIYISVLGTCGPIDYSPSSSFLNNVPRKELVIESYKRIYHNLPYLFKTKGSHGGLQALINIFGITGSILPIKEYGGTTDYQDLKGYSTDKVYISNNGITGSILSSIKRLETTPTSSRDVRSQDLHFVDISFSPQTQIDAEISSSISSVNSTWVIDDYIGDPRDIYKDNYNDLNQEKNYWFSQTFTHPTEGFDYNGFIRLIQFFDNSLFKMIKDFTPARGNIWTGVTIKSPVLERPKVPEARPCFSQIQEQDANYSGSTLIPIYDHYFDYLEGDKASYYNGNITSSSIDTYTDFLEHNVNPYLINNPSGVVPSGFMGGNTDFIMNYNVPYYENFFDNSDFNSLQNNVSESLTSIYRKSITPVYSVDSLGNVFTSYFKTGSVQLQDSNLSLTSYNTSRYDGTKLYGAYFNTWSIGDTSYGVSPVISYNTKKLGLFTEIVQGVLPYKSHVKLKYLVNESGSFTELNQRNRNWFEVQNTFKANESLNVSLFNPQQYSNQAITNGDKLIHESGYSYYPVFYGYGSSSFNQNAYLSSSVIGPTYTLAFLNNGNNLGNLINSFFTNYPSGGFFTPTLDYNPSDITTLTDFTDGAKEVWSMFNTTSSLRNISGFPVGIDTPPSDFGLNFYTGSGPGVVDVNNTVLTSSYYVIPYSGTYNFQYAFDIQVTGQITSEYTGSMQLWLSSSINGDFKPININTQFLSFNENKYLGVIYRWDLNNNLVTSYTKYIPGDDIIITAGESLNVYAYDFPECGDPTDNVISFTNNTTFKHYNVYILTDNMGFDYILDSNFYMDSNLDPLQWRNDVTNPKYKTITLCVDNESGLTSILSYNGSFVTDTSSQEYEVGDKIVFRYFEHEKSIGGTNIISASLNPYIIDDSTRNNISNIPFLKVIPSKNSLLVNDAKICVNQNANEFYLDSYFSSFYGPNYFFDPLNVATSSSFGTLYQEYGYIGYPFILNQYDKIIIQIEGESGYAFEYNINKVFITGDGVLHINIKEDISGYFENACNKYYKIVFLKKVPDETSVFIDLVKPPGKTSYGFIIPDNIGQEVINNIDTITSNSKTQLIDAGSSIITQ